MPLLATITIEKAKKQAKATIDAVHDYQRDAAKKMWPHGAILTCPKCRRKRTASTIELATFLGSGWPTCHGEVMWLGDVNRTR